MLFPGVGSENRQAKHLRRQQGRLWYEPVLSFPIGIIIVVIIIRKEKIDLGADKMSNEEQF